MKSKPLILIADDDQQIREALTARLLQSGFDVVSAPDTTGAIKLFHQHNPDAAVLDVRIPHSDGFDVCQHIRNAGSRIPVFFLTAADEGIVRRHLAALTATVGANYFLTKPYDGKTLVMMLRDALALRGSVAAAGSRVNGSEG